MSPRARFLLGLGLGVLILAGAAGTTLFVGWRDSGGVIANTSLGGPFTLTAGDGASVTEHSFPGKYLLIYFGYTFCPDACPTTLGNVAGALAKLGPDAAKLQPLFITVDPKRDTAKVMGDYVKAFDPRIVGLTGSPEQITAVARAFKVYVSPHTGEGASYLVDHSSFLYLMNPDGKFVRLLAGDTPADGLAKELKPILERAS